MKPILSTLVLVLCKIAMLPSAQTYSSSREVLDQIGQLQRFLGCPSAVSAFMPPRNETLDENPSRAYTRLSPAQLACGSSAVRSRLLRKLYPSFASRPEHGAFRQGAAHSVQEQRVIATAPPKNESWKSFCVATCTSCSAVVIPACRQHKRFCTAVSGSEYRCDKGCSVPCVLEHKANCVSKQACHEVRF